MATTYGRGYQCQIIVRRARLAHLRAAVRKMWGRIPAYLYKMRFEQRPMIMTMDTPVCGFVRRPELNPGST